MAHIKKQVTKIADKIVKEVGLELFDVRFYNKSGRWILEVIIDNPSGYINHLDCEKVSRALEVELDNLDLITKRYYLEVSSPGLDRPLRNKKDFERFKNHLAKIKTNEKTYIGKIVDVNDERVVLKNQKQGEIVVEFKNIKKANLEIEF
ncbi:ribosome maturation factor RimP [Thermosipho ferrireducens]|uniref:ribosome maturation factor RimP n=1 Tax=Thermosipho ferrireducens TaxID=2571116 RepID=UPI00389A407D